MPSSLSNGTTTITLPDDLLWVDRFAWNPVQASGLQYSVGGALLVDVGFKLAGRPMTLRGGPDFAAVTFATALQLQTMLSVPLAQLTLVYQDTTYLVMPDHTRQPLTVEQLRDVADPQVNASAELVFVTLALITR